MEFSLPDKKQGCTDCDAALRVIECFRFMSENVGLPQRLLFSPNTFLMLRVRT